MPESAPLAMPQQLNRRFELARLSLNVNIHFANIVTRFSFLSFGVEHRLIVGIEWRADDEVDEAVVVQVGDRHTRAKILTALAVRIREVDDRSEGGRVDGNKSDEFVAARNADDDVVDTVAVKVTGGGRIACTQA